MVVGVGCNDEARPTSQTARGAHGEVGAFRARACEDDVGDRARKRSEKPFRVGVHAVIEIACVRIENADLARHGGDDGGVAMPDGRHIVVGVENAAAVGFVEADTFGPHHVQGTLVEQH